MNGTIRELNWESYKNLGYHVSDAFEYISKRGIRYTIMRAKELCNGKIDVSVSRDRSWSMPCNCTKEVARVIRERWGENVSIFAEV